MVNSKAINCGSCGAPISLDTESCDYCGNETKLILCIGCGNSSLKSLNNCNTCGKLLIVPKNLGKSYNCPKCKVLMNTEKIDNLLIEKCSKCSGIFIDYKNMKTFIKKQTLEALSQTNKKVKKFQLNNTEIKYIKCPICNDVMSRKNYSSNSGKRSGVLVDMCLNDGIWFDKGEFTKVSEFLRSGGAL